MLNAIKISLVTLSLAVTSAVFASNPIEGIWQQIDDKSGSPKAVIEIRKTENGTFAGKIIKVTPRVGYKPQERCNKCPAPYTNQPILGMDVLTGLQHVEGTTTYEKGRVIDPLVGNVYNARIRLNANAKRLTLRGYMGVSALGRNQTWIRLE